MVGSQHLSDLGIRHRSAWVPRLVFGQLLPHGIEQPAHGNVLRCPTSSGVDDRLDVSTPNTVMTCVWAVCCKSVQILNTLGGNLAYCTCTTTGLLCIYRPLDFGDVYVSHGVNRSTRWMTARRNRGGRLLTRDCLARQQNFLIRRYSPLVPSFSLWAFPI